MDRRTLLARPGQLPGGKSSGS